MRSCGWGEPPIYPIKHLWQYFENPKCLHTAIVLLLCDGMVTNIRKYLLAKPIENWSEFPRGWHMHPPTNSTHAGVLSGFTLARQVIVDTALQSISVLFCQ